MTPSTTIRTVRVVIDTEVSIDGRIDDSSVFIHECGMQIASSFPTGQRWSGGDVEYTMNSTSIVSITRQ